MLLTARFSNALIIQSVRGALRMRQGGIASIRRCGDFQTGGGGFDIHAYIVYERSIKREWLKRLHGFQKFMQRKSAPAIAEVNGVPLIPFNSETFKDEDELEDLMYRSGFKQFMVDPFEYLNNLEKECGKAKQQQQQQEESASERGGGSGKAAIVTAAVGKYKAGGGCGNGNGNGGSSIGGLIVDDDLKNQMTEAIQRYLSAASNKTTDD